MRSEERISSETHGRRRRGQEPASTSTGEGASAGRRRSLVQTSRKKAAPYHERGRVDEPETMGEERVKNGSAGGGGGVAGTGGTKRRRSGSYSSAKRTRHHSAQRKPAKAPAPTAQAGDPEGGSKLLDEGDSDRERERVRAQPPPPPPLPRSRQSHSDDSDGVSVSVKERPPAPAPTSYPSYSFLRNKRTPPFHMDDPRGHYVYDLGDNFTKRYKILSHLGEGTFGKVIECWDRLNEEYVAIKVIRNVPKYRAAGMLELAVLNTIRKQQKNFRGGSHCVQFKEWFDYRGHICIVFSKLGLSLFDLLTKNGYRPFDLHHVQTFARQLLETVAFLHGIGLIHTDLKPENILLPTHRYVKVPAGKGSRRGTRVPEESDIFLIDFGSATFDDEHHSKIVSTRHYRAPEVILGLGWSFPCDIWSVGCILVELVTGEALFKTHDNLEHLAMMQRVLGEIPAKLVRQITQQQQRRRSASASSGTGGKAEGGGAGSKAGSKGKGQKKRSGNGDKGSQAGGSSSARDFFEENASGDGAPRLAWPERCNVSDSVQAVEELKDVRTLILEKCDVSVRPAVDKLVDLLKALLLFDPKDRISASEALEYSFFTSVETTPTTRQQQAAPR